MLSVLIHGVMVHYLRLPLLQRHYYQQCASVIVVIGFFWLTWRVLQWLLRIFRDRAIAAQRLGTSSLMLLGERMLKAAIVVLAIFSVLGMLGFNLIRRWPAWASAALRSPSRRKRRWRTSSEGFRFWATKSFASEMSAASVTAWARWRTSVCAPPEFALRSGPSFPFPMVRWPP